MLSNISLKIVKCVLAPCCKVPMQGDGVGWGATN